MTRHPKKCALCGSDRCLTFHHLIPRSCHRNKWFRKRYHLTEMREHGIDICRPCHSFIHKMFSEKLLGRELNSLKKLLENEIIRNYIRWAGKQRTSSSGNTT